MSIILLNHAATKTFMYPEIISDIKEKILYISIYLGTAAILLVVLIGVDFNKAWLKAFVGVALVVIDYCVIRNLAYKGGYAKAYYDVIYKRALHDELKRHNTKLA